MLKEKEVSVEWDQVEELERIDQEGSAGADQGSAGAGAGLVDQEEVEEVEVEKKVINKFDSITNLKLYYYF